MLPELIIGSRKSSLAKFQSYLVATRLKKVIPDLNISFRFMESQGDRDQNTPLWKMEGKSVFTQDLHKELIAGNINCIVHSWKDLDLEDRGESTVQSVLEREDARDVLLFKKVNYQSIINSKNSNKKSLLIATSSPRREWNLGKFLKSYFPLSLQSLPLQFNPIRGNIQTRLKKFIEQDFDALIVAKAALDRMLNPEILWSENEFANLIYEKDIQEFIENKKFIRECINQCLFMVLPLSQNPNAPAQGALCVEYLKNDSKIQSIFHRLENHTTSLTVNKEREVLSQFGGGCHQKIGVSILDRDYGVVQFIRGISDSGVDLEQRTILPKDYLETSLQNYKSDQLKNRYKINQVWPPNRKMAIRTREPIEINFPEGKDLFITRSNSLPSHWKENLNFNNLFESETYQDPIIWTAGLKTWKDLSDQNIWINGSFDSLGENEGLKVDQLLGRQLNLVKLTHDTENPTSQNEKYSIYPTYKVSEPIVPDNFDPNLIQAAFWRSTTEFEAMTNKFPSLLNVAHFCGPGSTYQTLKNKSLNPKVFLSFEDWLEETIEKEGN